MSKNKSCSFKKKTELDYLEFCRGGISLSSFRLSFNRISNPPSSKMQLGVSASVSMLLISFPSVARLTQQNKRRGQNGKLGLSCKITKTGGLEVLNACVGRRCEQRGAKLCSSFSHWLRAKRLASPKKEHKEREKKKAVCIYLNVT